MELFKFIAKACLAAVDEQICRPLTKSLISSFASWNWMHRINIRRETCPNVTRKHFTVPGLLHVVKFVRVRNASME